MLGEWLICLEACLDFIEERPLTKLLHNVYRLILPYQLVYFDDICVIRELFERFNLHLLCCFFPTLRGLQFLDRHYLIRLIVHSFHNRSKSTLTQRLQYFVFIHLKEIN